MSTHRDMATSMEGTPAYPSVGGLYSGNSTSGFLNRLELADSRQMKTSVLIVVSFNIAAAIIMIGNIYYDAWNARRRNTWSLTRKYHHLSIHPAEAFPLVLSVAVIAQGIVFIAVQSGGFNTVMISACRGKAEIVWPSLWIVTYTMLVFGLETTFRSFRRLRFGSRSRWNIPICIAIIIALLVITWIPSFLLHSPDQCMASLVWWTAHYAKIGIVIASGLMFTYMICAIIVTIQLFKTIDMDEKERIAATRIVYYLIFSVLTLALLLPFYIQVILGSEAQTTTVIAEIGLNLTGLINLVLHSFLRSNAHRSAIRGIGAPWAEKRHMRLFGPSDLDIGIHISSPVLLHKYHDDKDFFKTGEQQSPTDNVSMLETSLRQYTTSKERQAPRESRIEQSRQPLRIIPAEQTQSTSHYSVFPTQRSVARLSASTIFSNNSDSYLQIPAPLFGRNHHRAESEDTSATVQIGLRLSHAMSEDQEPLSSSESLQVPSRVRSGPFSRFRRSPSPLRMARKRDSGNHTDLLPPIEHPRSMFFKSTWPMRKESLTKRKMQRKPSVMKTLPEVPKGTSKEKIGRPQQQEQQQEVEPTEWPEPKAWPTPGDGGGHKNSWI